MALCKARLRNATLPAALNEPRRANAAWQVRILQTSYSIFPVPPKLAAAKVNLPSGRNSCQSEDD